MIAWIQKFQTLAWLEHLGEIKLRTKPKELLERSKYTLTSYITSTTLFFKLLLICDGFCSGYMSPEYAGHGKFSIKSDVFSFGVLVLEIVSGKRNQGFCHLDDHLNLLGHVSMKSFILLIYCVDRSFSFKSCSPSNQIFQWPVLSIIYNALVIPISQQNSHGIKISPN